MRICSRQVVSKYVLSCACILTSPSINPHAFRNTRVKTVTIDSGAQTSDAVEVSQSATGSLRWPPLAKGRGANVTFLASATRSGTFRAMYQADGTQVTASMSRNCWMVVPADAMAHHTIKVVAGTAQSAAQSLEIVLKD